MIKEIGSEFWEVDISDDNKLIVDKHHQYRLTGRTAIDFIIRDIKSYKELKSIYLPSYCCHTMVQPFIDNDVEVEFYDITFEEGKYTYQINFDTHCDAILIMQYFGFYNPIIDKIINRLKENRKIIIEDATHSWFSDNTYNNKSDYIFASFRKWTGLACGAIIIKQTRDFFIQATNDFNLNYIEIRKKAFALKKQFIENGIGQKDTFLELFSEAENLLKCDYKEYVVPQYFIDTIRMLDVKKIRKVRKENARILIDGLKNIDGLKSLDLCEKDVPLFVPIVVFKGKRDKLQKFLIANNVYCPVHWPLSHLHKIKDTYLYDNCLSLICDQRYGRIEMIHIIDLINDFYRKDV